MTVYNIVYSGAADTQILGQSTVYSTVRNSTTATAAGATSATGTVGNTFATPNYQCGQCFFVFDTSAIPAGGTGGYFSFQTSGTAVNANADTYRIRQVSSVANKIAGGSLSALTLHSDPGTFPTEQARYFPSISNASAIPRSSTFSVLLHSVNEQNNITPTGANRFSLNLSEASGSVDDPFLNILFGTAWEFVGVSNVVEVATTAHALVTTGITGLAAGDLLVACISSRIASTTSVTLPSGWTLVSEQKNNNVLATTSAASSGLMAYCVRGASDPALTFTHPVAPSVAIGRIIAYRGVDTSSPKDTQTSFTTATNTLPVSGAGLTTTQTDDLIVAMCAGGQEATWSNFNATDPALASGGSFSYTIPPTVRWVERADSFTATGADTSLAIYDAVKQTAGATGNLTATASLGAAHVVIAGAFKIASAAPAPVTGTGIPAAQASDTDGLGVSSSEGGGAPASQASAVSGLGTAAVPGVTGSGAPAAQASDADGTGVSAWISSGALVATVTTVASAGLSSSDGIGAAATDAATVAGAGTISTAEATGTGALATQTAAVAGAGLSSSSGSGAVNAQDATVAGAGAVASSGVGALLGEVATVSGAGVSSSIGTSNAVADPAAVTGTGSAAAANSGALVAESAAVAGEGVSSSDGAGATPAGAATIAGTGQSVSTGIGALACSPVTVAGVGVVLEEGVAVGDGALLAGAATISGEGEVTGEVAVPPVYGGYHYRPDRRPLPVEGYGYGILPQIEGEAHGVVAAAGRSIGALPRLAGQADAAAGAAGSSAAQLTIKVAMRGVAGTRGRGSGMIVKFEAAAAGRHDDDEAAIVAWLLAA